MYNFATLTAAAPWALVLGLVLAVPAIATNVTVTNNESYFTVSGLTNEGKPAIVPIWSRADPVLNSFSDSTFSISVSDYSHIYAQGEIDIATGGRHGDFVLRMNGNALVRVQRDPAKYWWTTGASVSARGLIKLEVTKPSCYSADGSVTSDDRVGYSESWVNLGFGPSTSFSSVGSGGVDYAPGPFMKTGEFSPGSYTVTTWASEGYALAGDVHKDGGSSRFRLSLSIYEDPGVCDDFNIDITD